MKKSTRQRKDSRRQARIRQAKSRQTQDRYKSPALTQAATWPVYECLISGRWQERFYMTQIIVARQGPDGRIAAGFFLVDLSCLGIKNAYGRIYRTQYDYRREMKEVDSATPLKPCTIHLAAKVLHAATEYAMRLGFAPHPDSREPLKLLGDADPSLASEVVSLGDEDNKPFYFVGPYDDAAKIVAQLRRAVGEGNYQVVISLGDLDDEESDDYEWGPPLDLDIFDASFEDERAEDDDDDPLIDHEGDK